MIEHKMSGLSPECLVGMVVTIVLAYPAVGGYGAVNEIWPGGSWEWAKPEQVGMDAGVLRKARAGKSLNKKRNSDYKAIEPFIEPTALSLKEKK